MLMFGVTFYALETHTQKKPLDLKMYVLLMLTMIIHQTLAIGQI